MLNKLALLVPALALVSGCNLADELTPKVGPKNAFVGGNAASQSAENGALQYAPPGGTAFAPGDCGAGTFTDADGDGWADAATSLTWETCVQEGGLGTVTIDGSVTITDTVPGTPSLAFSASPISLSATIVNVEDQIDLTVTADGSATGSAPSSITWDSHRTWTGNIEDVDVDIDEDIGWTTVYTSAGWTPGTALADGTLTIDGPWSATISGDELDGDVETTTPLTITAACESKITAGEIVISWDNGPSNGEITVTWSACGDRSVEVDL